MGRLTLEGKIREKAGKGIARKLRREGFVPAILYGVGKKVVPLQVKEQDFEKVRRAGGEHNVIELRVGESTTPAIIREEQFDPVWGRLQHIDFFRVKLTEKMRVSVPVVTVGESAGGKEGGVLDHVLREGEVECFADKIPENIEVDITSLNIGDLVHVRDVSSPESVEIVTEGDRVVVSIIAPRVVEEEVVEEAAEPELVGGEEKPEEEAEGAEEKDKGRGKEQEKEKEGEKEKEKGKEKGKEKKKE
jgi:large subunit ribosomal protein L25